MFALAGNKGLNLTENGTKSLVKMVAGAEAALFANISETAFAISNINKPGLDESCPTCALAETGTSYPADPTTVPNEYTSRLNGEGKRLVRPLR